MDKDNQPRQPSTTGLNQNRNSHSSSEQAFHAPARQGNHSQNAGCDRTTVQNRTVRQEIHPQNAYGVRFQNIHVPVRPPYKELIIYYNPMFPRD